MRFASRRRLNDFKSTSDRRRVDVGPTKDDVALTSSRRRLVMWVGEEIFQRLWTWTGSGAGGSEPPGEPKKKHNSWVFQ